jgi:hypothetical protein
VRTDRVASLSWSLQARARRLTRRGKASANPEDAVGVAPVNGRLVLRHQRPWAPTAAHGGRSRPSGTCSAASLPRGRVGRLRAAPGLVGGCAWLLTHESCASGVGRGRSLRWLGRGVTCGATLTEADGRHLRPTSRGGSSFRQADGAGCRWCFRRPLPQQPTLQYPFVAACARNPAHESAYRDEKTGSSDRRAKGSSEAGIMSAATALLSAAASWARSAGG